MELPVYIATRPEYEYCVMRTYQPLLDYKRFQLPIALRVAIQREIFGKSFISKGDVVKANSRFYAWVWEHKKHYCEECMKPLHNYSSVYISHILSRGSRPEMAHDPRNANILCYDHHQQWEEADRSKKKNRYQMRIYPTNLKIITLLKTDYQC